jgi:hypothetical protein
MKNLIVVLLLVLSLGCIGQGIEYTEEEGPGEESHSGEEGPGEESHSEEEGPGEESHSEEESLEIAREFVLSSPTYRFDGENLTHVETLVAKCPNCWIFIFEFTSRKAGYGDRSKQQVAQVITQHTAKVTVENGKVTTAVLDDIWDMISQKMIE